MSHAISRVLAETLAELGVGRERNASAGRICGMITNLLFFQYLIAVVLVEDTILYIFPHDSKGKG